MVAEIKNGITTCFLLAITLALLAACGNIEEEPRRTPQQAPSVSQAVTAPAQGPEQAPAAARVTAPDTQEPQNGPEGQEPTQTSVMAMNSPSETQDGTDAAQEGVQEPATAPPDETSVDVEQIDALDDSFFLEILSPEEDPAFVEEPAFVVLGRTRVDAAVSVNDQLVDVDADGILEAVVELEEGPNVIEVVASAGAGEEKSAVLTVFYLPQEG